MLARLLIALSLAWSGTISVRVAIAATPILTDNRLPIHRWISKATGILLAGVFGLIAILAGFVMAWRQFAG
jgi:hypothetical protein